VRVRYFGDGPENILGVSTLVLAASEPGIEEPGAERFEVETGAQGRTGEVRLGLRGITNRDAAEALKGRFVGVEAEHLAPLPEGEFYWIELIGCHVESTGGRSIGTVKEIWETGAHDVLVIEAENGHRCLIPTARSLMKEVDVSAGRIVVEDLPGLFDPVGKGAE
jgi:16S rRNA processing protein RimM